MKMEDREFDLKLRSLLADAEEEVPSGVWEAVSSRLSPVPAAGFSPWGWVGVGLAFAACLCAGIFFAGTRGTFPEEISQGLAEIRAAAPAEEPVFTLPEPEKASSSSNTVYVTELQTAVPDMIPVEEPLEEEMLPADDGFVPAEKVLRAKPLKSRGEIDPFAAMAYEDSKAARRRSGLTLQAGGNLGGNEFKGVPGAKYSVGKAAPSVKDNLTETSISQYGIPFSLGIGLRWYVMPAFSIGAGVDCSLLSRTFEGEYTPVGGQTESVDVRHTMCYLGIPVTVAYDFVDIPLLKFYAYARGTAEYAVLNKYSINSGSSRVLNEPVNGMQFSAGVGLGVEFKFSDMFGIYLNPGASYYFNCHQPKSLRTDRPLMFTLDAGFRINLR